MENRFIKFMEIDWNRIEKESYLREIAAFQDLKRLDFDKNVTYFVGENGTGKSTLLEAIAIRYGFNPEGGTLNYSFSTYDDTSGLADAVLLSKGYKRPRASYFFRAESFFNVATKAIDYESTYGGRNLHEQSHGESFLAFFQTFRGEGIYLMDEPEAALSPQRQLTLFVQIARMARQGAQFIVATHSPFLLGMPEADIYTFDDGKIHRCRYEDTESYQVTELFINNREAVTKRLLDE